MYSDLVEILQKNFGCEKPFDKNGEFTEEGSIAYEKLIDTLYSINNIVDNISFDSALNDVVTQLDDITNNDIVKKEYAVNLRNDDGRFLTQLDVFYDKDEAKEYVSHLESNGVEEGFCLEIVEIIYDKDENEIGTN